MTEPKEADLVEKLSHYSEDNNYLPEAGYIPDAETAKRIGSIIIDNLTGHNFSFEYNSAIVKYDEENRLWYVEKGYLTAPGGLVIIEQDTGRIVKALLTKY